MIVGCRTQWVTVNFNPYSKMVTVCDFYEGQREEDGVVILPCSRSGDYVDCGFIDAQCLESHEEEREYKTPSRRMSIQELELRLKDPDFKSTVSSWY